MRPVLLELGSLKFHAYPTMLAIAFLSSTLLAVSRLNRLDPPVRATTHGGLAAFLGGLIGAKVFWILQYDEPSNVWRAVFFWTQGYVFYGGLIGASLALLAYLVYNRLPVLRTADAVAPYLALGQGVTRIGCFLAGCCWGRHADLPWAVHFPQTSMFHWYLRNITRELDRSHEFTPYVHPTQLYMSAGLLLILFPVLLFVSRKPAFRGAAALVYLFSYGVLRFTVEAFRGDSPLPLWGMTISQIISLSLAIFALLIFVTVTSIISSPKQANSTKNKPEKEL